MSFYGNNKGLGTFNSAKCHIGVGTSYNQLFHVADIWTKNAWVHANEFSSAGFQVSLFPAFCNPCR